MRTFLPLAPLVPLSAIVLVAACSTTSRVFGTGGSGGKGTTTTTTTGTATTTSTTGGGGTTTGPGGMGGATTTTTTMTSSGCVSKSCTDLGLQCGMASDNCNQPIDCGFCPTGDVCGATAPNQCGTSAECASYASNVCTTYNACAPDVVTYLYGSVSACETRYALLCSLVVSEPETTWTPAKQEACGSALVSAGCQAFLLAPFTGGPPACQPTAGTRANGAGCIDSAQCASAYCQHAATSFCGTCVERGGAGAVCDTFLDCQAGFACVSGACAAALDQGAACTTGGSQCALGLYCQGGTCQLPLELNANCSGAGAQCNILEGLYCNTAVNKCLRAAGYAAAGQDCGVVMGDMLEGCTAAAICNGATCTAPAADGAACNVAGHVGCTNPAVCLSNGTSNVCALGTPTTCP
jgi:hypothetical protein